MMGARLTPALDCANDAEGQCAPWPSGNAHSCHGVSLYTAVSCGSKPRPAVVGRDARPGSGATPQSEGLVRARGRVRLRTPVPAPSGRSQPSIPAGRRFERRFEAANHVLADRAPVAPARVLRNAGSLAHPVAFP